MNVKWWMVFSALAIALFWLCPCVGFVRWGQRQMCAMCVGNWIFLCVGILFYFFPALAISVTVVCCPLLFVKMFVQSSSVQSCTVANRVSGNVLQIGDGRAFQHKSLFGELNFLLPQNCQAETKPRPLPMCCYSTFY